MCVCVCVCVCKLVKNCYLTAYQFLMSYLMPKFDLFVNI